MSFKSLRLFASISVLLLLAGCTHSSDTSSSNVEIEHVAQLQVAEQAVEAKQLEASQISQLSTVSDMQVVDLHGAGQTSMSQAASEAINAALTSAKANCYTVGFVMIDVTSGKAIVSNCNEKIYGASAIKGPFATYICKSFLETGSATLDSIVRSTTLIDYYSNVGYGSFTTQYLLQTMIEDSNNNALQFLSDAYNKDKGFTTYANSLGATLNYDDSYGVFPFFTTLDLAKMWFDTYAYLNCDSEFSKLLGSYMSNTSVSFIRDALPENVSVYNKAGYNVDNWYGGTYNGCVDSATFSFENRDYIISVMSNRPGTDKDAQITSLVQALFDARGELG